MFDISWTEFVLIGIVALIVIGPKELPGVLRTLGQYTRKVRGMAAEFQNQFQEAMREAEMGDLKKQVDEMAHDFKNYDPLKDVRSDVEAIDLSRNRQPIVQREFEFLLHAGLKFPRRKTFGASERDEVVQNGISQALGVIAQRNPFLRDNAHEGLFE